MISTANDPNLIVKNDHLFARVDLTHGGIRATGCLTFGIGLVVISVLVTAIFFNGAFNLAAILIAMIGAAGLTLAVDKLVGDRWVSQRELDLSNDILTMQHKEETQGQISLNKQTNVHLWHFVVPRQTRVPKGWYMVACGLAQEDEYICFYTLVSPSDFEAMPHNQYYVHLQRKKDLAKASGDAKSFRLAGEQKRLHESEQLRQLLGAEMTSEQFNATIRYLEEHYPQWLPFTV